MKIVAAVYEPPIGGDLPLLAVLLDAKSHEVKMVLPCRTVTEGEAMIAKAADELQALAERQTS